MMPKFKTPTEEIKHLQVSLERAHKGIKKSDEKLKQREMDLEEMNRKNKGMSSRLPESCAQITLTVAISCA